MFDAKECAVDVFPLQNIHQHQVDFMKDFEGQQGVAFLILYFSHRDEIYYLTFVRCTVSGRGDSREVQSILNIRNWSLSGSWKEKEMFWCLFWMGSREIWRAENRNLRVYTEQRKGTSSEAPFFVYFIYHGN